MSMTDMNSPVRIGGLTDEVTQAIIAPVQKTLVATKNYAKDDLFIFNNELYKATKVITNGTTISIGTGANDNADYASTLAEEMRKSGVKSVTYKGANGIQSIGRGSSLVINCTTKVGTEDLTDYEVVGLGGYLIGSINGLMVKMVDVANKQLGLVNYTNEAISNYDTSNVSMTIYYKHI